MHEFDNTERHPLVIAHRGASGYLPEHTSEAKVLAFAMGADYLEQDIVASRDGALLVLHDHYLEAVTDVAVRFPNRARPDGHFYAIDFDLSDIRELEVGSRRGSGGEIVFPRRYSGIRPTFRIHTFEEELELVGELNRQLGRNVGVYPEIKAPQWHHQHGCDLGGAILACLQVFGYTRREDPVFVQCFDPNELSRLRNELHTDLKLIQLIGSGVEDGVDHEGLASVAGLEQSAALVDGVGPSLQRLVDPNGRPLAFTAEAHRLGLAVHAYTFRAERLPAFSPSFAALLRHFMETVGVDGMFCDFPDQAVWVRNQLAHPED